MDEPANTEQRFQGVFCGRLVDPALAKLLDLQFFHDNGFVRKECPSCGNPYWCLDAERDNCGDSTCTEYSFLGAPLSKKPLSLPEMREAFQAFWETRGHTRVPRNPVVARWRDDIYLNIASIANYQPHTTSGDVPPPANPLVVSQPCIRLNDLANIGRSGRHFSCFEMMGHHAFNSADWGEHYWTEECVSGGHEFLTNVLGLEPKSLTYVESTWSGGGNAGPCVEVFAGGLEVATLVFMCLEEAEESEAEFTIKGDGYKMMDLRIIDTGWGLERLAWASTGTPSAYETVFPDTLDALRAAATVSIADDARSKKIIETHAIVQGVLNLDVGMKLDALRAEVVDRLKEHGIDTTAQELEDVMGPVEALYALADHLRCLSFMVGDGLVPGNVKAGYLMRLMFRRALGFRSRLGIQAPLSDLLAANMERMLDQFPAFEQAIPRAREMADLETERHQESQERGGRLVARLLQKKTVIDTEQLLELYDTHGIGPGTVAHAAAEQGVTVEIPDDFDILLAERHSKEKKAKAKQLVPADVPATRRIFYEDDGQWEQTFEATVTWAGQKDGQDVVTLDQTCFFHETGGQPGDVGHLGDIEVLNTLKDGDHCLHVVAKPIDVGTQVTGTVDWDRRMDHTRSHTATHIMNQAVRRVLGPHSWQAGTQKYHDCARVDMSHYRRPNPEELTAIERLANAVVMEGRPVHREWWQRQEAEAKWGMQLLQGGIPKGTDVRVVRIGAVPVDQPLVSGLEGDFDVEYCGGTHCRQTSQVGPIKLWRTERIQDGVERFEYSAGHHAVGRWQNDESLLKQASEALSVSPNELPAAAARFFDEWKERGKLLEEVQKQLAELKAAAAGSDAETVNGVRIVVQDDLDPGAMQQTAANLIGEGKTVALLAAPAGPTVRLLFARSGDVDLDMGGILREAGQLMGAKGGGRPDFAQGAGNQPDQLGACLDAAAAAVKAGL
ncbi:MAG: alanine--tRNA ligase [Thermoplasmatota archaeon]